MWRRMLNLNSVMIGTQRPQELAAFYEQVIGEPADMVDGEQGFYGWQVGSAFLGILEHSDMGGSAKDPGRVMLNFETAQVKEEFERIKALGAAVIAAPYQIGEGWIATLADPDGNYFQLMSPMG
jgi:predicted enzyme related to lactoylglutathione lyase